MLIEFSVSNFRSFREKQTFSMVAAPRLGKKGNLIKANIKNEKFPDLLRVAAIYGSNASGKSNLVKALSIVSGIANRKSADLSKGLPVAPFRFDPALANQPSRFEIHFIVNGQRYEFDLAATADRIMEERLVLFQKGKGIELYKRQHKPSGEEYSFHENLEGGQILFDAWRKLTSPRVLFIAQAVANSNEELQQLRIPFQWLLDGGLKSISGNMGNLANVALSLGAVHKELESHISAFVQELDIPITNIQFELKDSPQGGDPVVITDDLITDVQNEQVRSIMKSYNKVKATLTHRTALGDFEFDFNEESEGTKNLIGFSLPWATLISNKTIQNYFVIDELDSSLHPKIVACLIDKLLKVQNSTQLIFTTHDTHLMDTKLLRRDQIWLTERDMNGATKLRSIHDFEGRESEDVEKRYYEGRYRGLPILP